MKKSTNICRVPQYVSPNLHCLKKDLNDVLTTFDELECDTMLCTVIAIKNEDGSYTANIAAIDGKEIKEFKFENSFVKSLLVNRE